MASPISIPVPALKGRGSARALAHRFEIFQREAVDDGWPRHPEDDGACGDEALKDRGDGQGGESLPAGPPTEVVFEPARSAISRNDAPDLNFVQGLNPYRGCEHGCSYCYARPTHSYLNLSPGLDFETRIIAKTQLAPCLARELGRRGYQPQPIVIGSATDAYQPVERRLRITRSVLEVLQRCHHPLAIVTKSSGVERDLDLLAPMAARHLAAVHVTLTTLDPELARRMEPRAASPQRRLRTIRALAEAGVPVGVSVAPQIPFINEDMERVLEAAAEAGARQAFYAVLRLPWEVNPVFQEWLAQHYPLRADRVMARVREMRGGRDYDSDFATRMKGQGTWAGLLRSRFETACRRLGLNQARRALDVSQFQPALLNGQASLF